MYLFKLASLFVLVGLTLGLNIPTELHRAACAQVDFDDLSKISYWSPFAGLGPVVGHGIGAVESENMLTEALEKIKATDENQYRQVEKLNFFNLIFLTISLITVLRESIRPLSVS